MAYWVYENSIHKKARIHTAECSFCGSGRGIHGGGKTASGIWHGPFSDFEAATTAAYRTKQPDIRGCNLCTRSLAQTPIATVEIRQAEATRDPDLLVNRDNERELNCSLKLRWKSHGRLAFDENSQIKFPAVQERSGLYRFSALYPDGRFAQYIGESDNLRRRFGNYRNPGPTQQTSLRINAWLKELISDGGEVLVAIAEKASLNEQETDFSRKAVRRMFENMAIAVEEAEDVESLNR